MTNNTNASLERGREREGKEGRERNEAKNMFYIL